MVSENAKGIIAWINVCVIRGTTYLVIRIGVGHMPPMLFAGIRWVIAGIIFITVPFFMAGIESFLPNNLKGVLGFLGAVIFWSAGSLCSKQSSCGWELRQSFSDALDKIQTMKHLAYDYRANKFLFNISNTNSYNFRLTLF